jgi:hypothetical protein
MATPLIITEVERDQLRSLYELAQANPVDVAGLLERIKEPENKRHHMAQMTRQTVDIPLAFRVTFSIETGHPCGRCRHMSMSVQRLGRVPHPAAVWMIAQELGFWGGLDQCAAVWYEELLGHGRALNVVQPLLKT